jgi:hypothetical protein
LAAWKYPSSALRRSVFDLPPICVISGFDQKTGLHTSGGEAASAGARPITTGTMHTISVAFAACVHRALCVQAIKWEASSAAGRNAKLKLRPEDSPQFFSFHAYREATETPPTTTTGKPKAGCGWLALIIST